MVRRPKPDHRKAVAGNESSVGHCKDCQRRAQDPQRRVCTRHDEGKHRAKQR